MRRAAAQRDGVASVELALTMPIVLMLFASFVFLIQAFMVSNTAEAAAYFGARKAIVNGVTEEEVKEVVAAKMASGMVAIFTTDVEWAEGQAKVTVSVPMDGNAWIIGWCPTDLVIERTCDLAEQAAKQAEEQAEQEQ